MASPAETAKSWVGMADGKIAEPVLRDEILHYDMDSLALQMTQRRVVEESKNSKTPGPATSIFKVVGTELQQQYYHLMTGLKGTQGFGWEGDSFGQEELETVRDWLFYRAASIYSGSNEIQRNIIAKRVLGLPD